MKKIILLKGLPASGKSTWAKEEVIKWNWNIKRINKDDLRAMLDNNKWTKWNEKIVLWTRDLITEWLLEQWKTVIIDDTNFAPQHEERMKELAKKHNAKFEVKFFDTDVETCIDRDSLRENPVWSKVIYDMYNKYLAPEFKPLEFDNNLPTAIICDVDGTLALKWDRDIYDTSKVHLDSVIIPTATIINSLYNRGTKILIVTGRDWEYLDITKKWLDDNGIKYDEIYTRPAWDNRSDTIIKREIYDNHINWKYNVTFALDDRFRLVNQRRDMGIYTFDCNQTREIF